MTFIFAVLLLPSPLHVHAAEAATAVEWVTIPGGSFMMGSQHRDERPPHRVTLKSFQLARTEVTNGQYRACVAAKACSPQKTACLTSQFSADDQPAVCVSWTQARDFSLWVGGRLPSEAEWEYAARSAGKDRKYPWGDSAATCDKAVISEGGFGCGRGATWPVCSKPAGNTEQGLCDMAGNAWEWVQDWYQHSYDGAPVDGSAREIPPSSDRVVRGGCWRFDGFRARAAERDDDGARRADTLHSFRPAR